MTRAYEWNPMPHRLDVVCPRCAARAHFAFATVVRVAKNVDIPALQRVSALSVESWSHQGQRYPVAVYQPALHGPAAGVLDRLPDGYVPLDWAEPRFLVRSHASRGAVRCEVCGLRREHSLRWPTDAWFVVMWRGALLWAWHRESAAELRDWLASTDRRLDGRRWRGMLMKVPGVFTTAKARERVVKLLDRRLAE
jgi:hypothetical protein